MSLPWDPVDILTRKQGSNRAWVKGHRRLWEASEHSWQGRGVGGLFFSSPWSAMTSWDSPALGLLYQRDPSTCHGCVLLHSYWMSLELYSSFFFSSQALEIESSRVLSFWLLLHFNILKIFKEKKCSAVHGSVLYVMWIPKLMSNHWKVFQWPLTWEEFFQLKTNKQTNK